MDRLCMLLQEKLISKRMIENQTSWEEEEDATRIRVITRVKEKVTWMV